MLIFDQLKKGDPHLRTLTLVILTGLAVLLAGLWWVQIVSARDYQESLETQSFRTVRIPAVRGRILDRNGNVLAENRPAYNISLYLEELDRPFKNAYSNEVWEVRAELKQQSAQMEAKLGRKLNKQERKQLALTTAQKALLREKARYEVVSNVVLQVSRRLDRPLTVDPTDFERHYETRLALPYPVLRDLDATNIARFEEQSTSPLGVDLEVQSTRVYPHQTLAAHLLGSLRRDDSSAEGEEAFFSFRLPDFRGAFGIEYAFDKALRGMAGAKSVEVNNMGYRTTENVWSPAEPGSDVVLTLDLAIQQAAERALQSTPVTYTGPVRGAVVVMDVWTGDILALASSPAFNPNDALLPHLPPAELERRENEVLRPIFNRATQGSYFPGSVFKLVVGLAALDAGLDPNETFVVAPNPEMPSRGAIWVGPAHHKIRDLAPPGEYNFTRALYKSSNSYFITNGLRIGPERIVRMAQRFHLGEKIGLFTRQESSGFLPSLSRLSSGWSEGNTANLSIGQDPVMVTPLQVAVLTSAIANGGKVLWPRLVAQVEPQQASADQDPERFPPGRVRDQLGVSQRILSIVHQAMLADTEAPDGTGVGAARECPGLRICGKTGTAQIQNENNVKTGQTTWFASFAPYEKPRWAVVVMVEDGISGPSCSFVAGKIYRAILDSQRNSPRKNDTMANARLTQ